MMRTHLPSTPRSWRFEVRRPFEAVGKVSDSPGLHRLHPGFRATRPRSGELPKIEIDFLDKIVEYGQDCVT
jgi:hypothetical protein